MRLKMSLIGLLLLVSIPNIQCKKSPLSEVITPSSEELIVRYYAVRYNNANYICRTTCDEDARINLENYRQACQKDTRFVNANRLNNQAGINLKLANFGNKNAIVMNRQLSDSLDPMFELSKVQSSSNANLVKRSQQICQKGKVRGTGLFSAVARQDPDDELTTFTFVGHSAGIVAVSFRPFRNTLAKAEFATASLDGTVRIWDVEDKVSAKLVLKHDGDLSALAYSADGSSLFSGTKNQDNVRQWDPINAQIVQRLFGHQGAISSLSFVFRLVSGSRDGTIILWDLKSAQPNLRLSVAQALATMNIIGSKNEVLAVSQSGDDELVAALTEGGHIVVWNVNSGDFLQLLPQTITDPTTIAFVNEGVMLAIGTASGRIIIWDTRSAQVSTEFMAHQASIDAISFSGVEKGIFATAAGAGEISLWNSSTWKEIKTIQAHSAKVNSLQFSSNEDYLASGSDDRTAKVWDMSQL